MKGASAEPSVKTMSIPSSSSTSMIGPSQNFLRTRMKSQSSRKMLSFSRRLSLNPMSLPPETRPFQPTMPARPRPRTAPAGPAAGPGHSIQLEEIAPVDVLGQRLHLPLVEDEAIQHQVVHLGAHEAEVGVMGR